MAEAQTQRDYWSGRVGEAWAAYADSGELGQTWPADQAAGSVVRLFCALVWALVPTAVSRSWIAPVPRLTARLSR